MQILQIGPWSLTPNMKWPYLYFKGDPRYSMGLSCETPIEGKLILSYGENYESFKYSIEDPEPSKLHFFRLTNLKADTKYYWKLSSSNPNINVEFLDKIYEFRTAPKTAEKKAFKFCVLGDTRTDILGNTLHSHLIKEIIKAKPNFMINVGDMVLGPGISWHWDRFFYEVRGCAQNGIPYMISIGNHEWDGYQWLTGFEEKGKTYKYYMEYPEPENYYTFNYGNVAFISIDTNDEEITDVQLEWLERTLKSANMRDYIDFIIVFGHHPLYSENGRSNRIGNKFEDLFIKYNVDMYLAGHIHHYARSKVNGTTYIVSGGGGAELDDQIEITNPYTIKASITFHYCSIEVEENHLFFKSYSHEGILFDECILEPRKGG
ncbi:MAG: metallophosphoesterase [Promethearchaeota archaeon]